MKRRRKGNKYIWKRKDFDILENEKEKTDENMVTLRFIEKSKSYQRQITVPMSSSSSLLSLYSRYNVNPLEMLYKI